MSQMWPVNPNSIERFTPYCGPPCTEEDGARHQRYIDGLKKLQLVARLAAPDFPCQQGLDLMELFSPYHERKCFWTSGAVYDMGKLVFDLSDMVLKHCPDEYKARQQQ